jgi:hypothetical protein
LTVFCMKPGIVRMIKVAKTSAMKLPTIQWNLLKILMFIPKVNLITDSLILLSSINN